MKNSKLKVVQLHAVDKTPEQQEASTASATIKALVAQRKGLTRAPLSIAKVQGTAGAENLSDAAAQEVVDGIRALSATLYRMHCLEKLTCIDNQHVVCLKEQNKAA